jgi:hypothetical protein
MPDFNFSCHNTSILQSVKYIITQTWPPELQRKRVVKCKIVWSATFPTFGSDSAGFPHVAATISAIADAIPWAEEILRQIDERFPAK